MRGIVQHPWHLAFLLRCRHRSRVTQYGVHMECSNVDDTRRLWLSVRLCLWLVVCGYNIMRALLLAEATGQTTVM